MRGAVLSPKWRGFVLALRWPRRATAVKEAIAAAIRPLAPRWLERVEPLRDALAAAVPYAWREPLMRNRREIAATCLAAVGVALFALGAGLL